MQTSTTITSKSADVVQHYFRSVLTDLSWHPTEDLLVTAGLDRKAKLISLPSSNVIQ
jgi:hypothetical protein